MKGLLTLASALLALGAQAAFAQTGGEVTGRVLDTDTTNNELRISVLESDDGRADRVGQTETYYVPPDVEIVIDDYPDRSIAAMEAGANPDLGDLVPGQEVVIRFEEGAQGRQATSVRSGGGEDQQQAAQTEEPAGETYEDTYAAGTQERDRLPGSASPLPLIALAGAGFAIVAGWLRHRRR